MLYPADVRSWPLNLLKSVLDCISEAKMTNQFENGQPKPILSGHFVQAMFLCAMIVQKP